MFEAFNESYEGNTLKPDSIGKDGESVVMFNIDGACVALLSNDEANMLKGSLDDNKIP